MSRIQPAGSGRREALPTFSGKWRGVRATSLVIAVTTAVALALRLIQLLRPGYLFGFTEYDDGIYFGSAVRLAAGVLPYRDYAFVQPPGITVLMYPLALLARVTGTAGGLAAARVATALAGAAAAPLAGLLVRHRGVLATLVAGGLVAVFPAGISAAHTVLLEPWLVVACLAGALALFDGDRLASRPARLAWAGAAFGVGGAIKAWAIVPVAVIGVLCLLAPPGGWAAIRRLLVVAGGTVAGFAVLVLPFAALAPRSFVDGVIVSQLASSHRGPGLVSRFRYLSGLSGLPHPVSGPVILTVSAAIAAVAVLAAGAAWLLTRRPPPALDWFALLAAAAVTVSFLWPSRFYYHYAAFLAPFLALSLALPLARLAAGGFPGAAGAPGGAAIGAGPGARILTAAAAAVLVAMAAIQLQVVSSLRPAWVPGPALVREMPRGACVVASVSSLAIAAGRFSSDVPGCHPPLDALATLMVMTGGRGFQRSTPAELARVSRVWQAAFARAQVVWLYGDHGYIPWDRQLFTYFTSRFRPVKGLPLSPFPPCGSGTGRSCHPPGGLYVLRRRPGTRLAPGA